MLRNVTLTAMFSVVAFLSADGQAQTNHAITDSVSVTGAVAATDNGGSLVLQTDPSSGNILNDIMTATPPGPWTAPAGPGGVYDATLVNPDGSMGGANYAIDYQYVIRERANSAQLNRTCYSFLSFDVSSLTLADVNDPTFVAEFTVDYVGALNILNGPGQYGLGTVNTAWDSTTNLPTTLTGEEATFVPGAILIANSINPVVAPGPITVDVTSAVKGWVDGTIANNGLAFIETDGTVNTGDDIAGPTTSQSGYFSNAVLTTDLSSGTVCGDVNLDGAVSFLDIQPFIAILSSGGFQAEADCDGNGAVNFLDIQGFIAALSGP